MKVDPFSKDSLKFKVANPSLEYQLVIENIYYGIVTCSHNPFLLSKTESTSVVELVAQNVLEEPDLSGISNDMGSISLTKLKYSISSQSAEYFSVKFDEKKFKKACDEAAMFRCPNGKKGGVRGRDMTKNVPDVEITNQQKDEIVYLPGTGLLFIMYSNPITGKSEKLYKVIYNGNKFIP